MIPGRHSDRRAGRKSRPLLAGFSFWLLATFVMAGSGIAGDPVKGERVFKKCAACHKLGPKAINSVGPILNGIVGRPFGSVEDYKYSKNLQQLTAEERIWDIETLDQYLTNPKSLIPRGKMAFVGLRKLRDRKNVIEYLQSFDAEGNREE